MADVPISGVPPIPPLSTISSDREDVKKVLKPLIDGWETRNGTTGDQTEAFVRVADLIAGRILANESIRTSVGADGRAKKSSLAAQEIAKLLYAPEPSDSESTVERTTLLRSQAQRNTSDGSGSASTTRAASLAPSVVGVPSTGTVAAVYGGITGMTYQVHTEVNMSIGQVALVFTTNRVVRMPPLYKTVKVLSPSATPTGAPTPIDVEVVDTAPFSPNGGFLDLAISVITPSQPKQLQLVRFFTQGCNYSFIVAANALGVYVAAESGVHKFSQFVGIARAQGYYLPELSVQPPQIVAIVV